MSRRGLFKTLVAVLYAPKAMAGRVDTPLPVWHARVDTLRPALWHGEPPYVVLQYHPATMVLSKKVPLASIKRPFVHAFDCDMDEDCMCDYSSSRPVS